MDEFENRNDLECINSLKELKKEGKLDFEECWNSQVYKWRNTVEYRFFENWLKSDNEELRLNALELLTISKKSTLAFTKQELNLITLFLKCNMREKIEHVPLIKRVLRRLNDSYLVLKRQLERENKFKELKNVNSTVTNPPEESNAQASIQFYKSFVNTLHLVCIRNLYPGAVNVRRKSSLQILCLMDEFLCDDFKNSSWHIDHYKVLVDCILLDTYEMNKNMAFLLIKASKLTDTFFDTKEKLLELITVAIELGNNVRPLDGITAAYMLRIGMLSSKIEEVIAQLTNFDKTDCITEKTAFLMILLLKLNLQDPVKLAKENIVVATSKHALYGHVFCIHNILSTIDLRAVENDECWRDIVAKIVNMCFELNTAVSQIVNNSSPEGHLPMDLDVPHLNYVPDDNNVVITAQRVLLCSWRTVKEISLFFGYLTLNAPIYSEKTKIGLLTEDQIKGIGNQLVTLLCETKHRGAFEQAHVGFQPLCNRLWHLDNETHASLKNLPKFWLQQILLAVVGLTIENSKLCATRRSAGVPFMVQALVTSEIKKRSDAKKFIFHSVMKILLNLVFLDEDFNLSEIKSILCNETIFNECEQSQYLHDLDKTEKECVKLNEITEIKTHALNILRALFRHSLLGDLVKDYIAEGFIAAFKSYDGKSWAERNAATLLFSSLVVRVFGVQRTKDHVNLTVHNKMSGKLFFEKYPILLNFLINELQMFVNSAENQIKPKIQCMLLILSRLYLGTFGSIEDKEMEKGSNQIVSNQVSNTTNNCKLEQFIDLVSKCGKSRVWRTRELAARALVSLITKKNISSISYNIIQLMTSYELVADEILNLSGACNLLHGYTLQFLEITRSPLFATVELSVDVIQKLINLAIKLLENLENSEESACFPASTAILEIFIELSKMNLYSYIYKSFNFLNLHTKIQAHLTNNNVLKKKPGIELYEVAAVNLLLTENYFGSLINYEYFSTQFFDYLLKHKNEEVLSISWSKLIYIVRKTNNAMLYDLGFLKGIKTLDIPVDDPELQDSIYDFVYHALQEMEEGSECTECTFSKDDEKMYMCMHIFTKMNALMKMKGFYPRGKFFKLISRAFGFLLKTDKYTEFTMATKKAIYDAVSSHSTMESNVDCRIGISEVLPLLHIELNHKTKENDIYLILQWWTTLLQLLYDDNAEVRSNAVLIVSKILPETIIYCETIVANTFFVKFVSTVREVIDAVAAACFCWSMKFTAIVLEEMDETDVFNKSYNYECFDPLHISRNCLLHLRCIILKHNVNTLVLSKEVKEWLQKELELNDSFEFDTLNDLIINYKEMIPDSEKSLRRILDPTYTAKLIKEIAYDEIKAAVIRKTA